MVTATFKTLQLADYYLWMTKGIIRPIAFVAGFWYLTISSLQEAIRARQDHDPPPNDGSRPPPQLWEVICFFLPGTLMFTAFFFRVRGIEMSYLLIFCLLFPLALPLAVIWDVFTIAFLGAQYILLAVGSYSTHLLLLVYFLGYSVFSRIQPSAIFACQLILSQSTKIFIFRLRGHQECDAHHRDHLCDVCQTLVRDSWILKGSPWGLTWSSETHPHHTKLGMEVSAGDCQLCSLLLRSIVWEDAQSYGTFAFPNVCLDVRIWEDRTLAGEHFIWAQIVEKQLQSSPIMIERSSRVVSKERQASDEMTDSAATIAWARRQIHDCCAEHSICQNYFVPEDQRHHRPTRLIDIKDGKVVTLKETSEIPALIKLEYIAFSHCWGRREIGYKLCKDTVDDMKKAISVERLARNFQHAIHIARQLGVQYLWLDSLCILQDSEVDWITESKTMGVLHANALCVVSATASPDAHGGCFFPMQPLLGDCVLHRNDKTSLVATLSRHKESDLAYLFESKVDSAAATERGWTFQERVLAGRVLHFCDGLVLFECNTLQSSNRHSMSRVYPRNPSVRVDGRAVIMLGPTPPPRPPRPSWPLPKLGASGSSQGLMMVTWEYITIRNWFNNHPISRPRRNYITTAIPTWAINPDYEARSYSVDSYYNFSKTYQEFKEFASWSPQRDQVVDMSARVGMRGAFELLLSFQGTTLSEALQFHKAWYNLVEAYSVRKLSHPDKDKVFAIDGIASFIRANTGFTFHSGVWANHVPLTLFWTRGGALSKRPRRGLPSWTWASVDGRITNPLTLQHDQKPLKLRSIELLCNSISAVANTHLRIHGTRVIEINVNDVTYTADVANLPAQRTILCIPLLHLSTVATWQVRSKKQVHGLVVRIDRDMPLPPDGSFVDQQYERIGYFWSEQEEVVNRIIENPQKRWMVISLV